MALSARRWRARARAEGPTATQPLAPSDTNPSAHVQVWNWPLPTEVMTLGAGQLVFGTQPSAVAYEPDGQAHRHLPLPQTGSAPPVHCTEGQPRVSNDNVRESGGTERNQNAHRSAGGLTAGRLEDADADADAHQAEEGSLNADGRIRAA